MADRQQEMMSSFQIDIKKALDELLQGPKYPTREFVCSGSTFGEVYAMAAGLRVMLSGPEYEGITVCLATDNKAIMAAAILASLAGGPSLLLPYTLSDKVLVRMQQTVGFTTVISDGKKEFADGVKVICPTPAGASEIPVSNHVSPQSELLKIYTGGSTGTPQMWSKTGENIVSEVVFLAKRYEVTEYDCILATVPPNHIYGLLFTVILPLVSMATVVGQTPSFPGEIVSTAGKHQVTIMASVPAHYRVLRNSKMSLRLAFSSAGMLDAEDNDAFCHKNRMGVTEVYGSTETGGIATRNRWLGEEDFTPFPSIRWKVIKGCLAVRSPYVSPDLPIDEEGFFTANDRVEKRGADSFILQGRADNVTKVGGKRVDLEEIRRLIKTELSVTDCVVMAIPQAGGRENRIGALIQGGTIDMELIKQALVDSLEPYALPRHLKTVEQIPVKKNGKYDWVTIAQLLEK